MYFECQDDVSTYLKSVRLILVPENWRKYYHNGTTVFFIFPVQTRSKAMKIWYRPVIILQLSSEFRTLILILIKKKAIKDMIKALGFCFPLYRQLNSPGRDAFKENVGLHGVFAYQLKETMELQKINQKLEEDKTLLLQEKVCGLVLILFQSPPGRGTSGYRIYCN